MNVPASLQILVISKLLATTQTEATVAPAMMVTLEMEYLARVRSISAYIAPKIQYFKYFSIE